MTSRGSFLHSPDRRSSSSISAPLASVVPQKRKPIGPPVVKGEAKSEPSAVPLLGLGDARVSKRERPHPTIHNCSGQIPRITGLFTRVLDFHGEVPYMYIIGGSQEDNEPTRDFFRLNLKTLCWENLSGVFQQCLDGTNPFRRRCLHVDLPPLDNPTSQLYLSNNRSFIILFGGSNACGDPTSNVITINIAEQTWEYVETCVTDPNAGLTRTVVPRSGAGSAIIDDRLFIFGGWTRPNNQTSIGAAVNCDSFSVLDLKTREWVVADYPLPNHVGSLGYNLDVYSPPFLQGHKVLLVRGRLQDEGPLCITPEDMFIFNTQNFKFHSLSTEADGTFPLPLRWCDISPHRGSPSICVAYGPKHNHDGGDECPSDLWSYNALTDRWTCEQLEDVIWELDADLQILEHIPGRGWCLIGYKEPIGKSGHPRGRPRKTRRQTRTAPVSSIRPECWNVCVNLNIEIDA